MPRRKPNLTVTMKEYYRLPDQREKTDDAFLKQIKYLERVKIQ